jgi:2-keto-4-pentenoate hydratase
MQSSTHDAARMLWACRQSGRVIDALPEPLRPLDAAAGHAIQAALPDVAGQPVVGWKIAATSAAGQAHIQVDGPLAGRILGGFVHPVGATLGLAGNRMRVVEPEFAFRLGADLPPRAAPYGVDEVLAAVASLHPAFELPDSRFAEFTLAGKAQLIADDACCGRFAFGPAAPASWREADLAAHRVHATVHGADGQQRYIREGEGRALLGDPRTALAWLANELSSLGIGLRAGDWASCGTCMVPLEILPGDRVVADYGHFGRIEIALCDEGDQGDLAQRKPM